MSSPAHNEIYVSLLFNHNVLCLHTFVDLVLIVSVVLYRLMLGTTLGQQALEFHRFLEMQVYLGM